MTKEHYKIHHCPSQPKEGVEIALDQPQTNPTRAWTLFIHREATEEDLEENSYLENIGDTIWETRLEISHCPFCGRELEESGGNFEGGFVHVDCSGWTYKSQ